MTILCVSTASADPILLRQQLVCYNHCFSGNVFHVIHVSKELDESLSEAERELINSLGNVHLFTRVTTKHGMIFHAMLQGVLEALRIGISFDYVYFHTSSDLLVKNGIDEYIRQFDVGATSPYLLTDRDYWFGRVTKSLRSSEFLAVLGQKNRMKVRAEGTFFKKEIFFEIIYPFLTYFGSVDFNSIADYPVEEVEFSWCIEFYCSRNKVRRAKGLIKTLGGFEDYAGKNEIDRVREQDGIYGLKRFRRDRYDCSREYAFESIGLSKSDL